MKASQNAVLIVSVLVIGLMSIALFMHSNRGPVFTGATVMNVGDSGVIITDNQKSDWEQSEVGRFKVFRADVRGVKWVNVENDMKYTVKVAVHASENYAKHLPVDTAIVQPYSAKLFEFNTKDAYEDGWVEIRVAVV